MQNAINGMRKWLSVRMALVLLKKVICLTPLNGIDSRQHYGVEAGLSRQRHRAVTGALKLPFFLRRLVPLYLAAPPLAEFHKQIGRRRCKPIRWALKIEKHGWFGRIMWTSLHPNFR